MKFWWNTIKDLRIEKKKWEAAYAEGISKKTQLSYDLIEARQQISGYESTIETLESENERQATINQALAEENRDLVRKLELYRAIFRQLNIDVKFPVNKTRG